VNKIALSALLLLFGLVSCKPMDKTAAPVTKAEPIDPEIIAPETVRPRHMQNDNHGIKTLTIGNANGDYVLSCDIKQETCLTPEPGKDYYLFKNNTKWKFPGAKDYVTLAWWQDWSIKYNHGENIALVPVEGGMKIGMYWLDSWEDKKQ